MEMKVTINSHYFRVPREVLNSAPTIEESEKGRDPQWNYIFYSYYIHALILKLLVHMKMKQKPENKIFCSKYKKKKKKLLENE